MIGSTGEFTAASGRAETEARGSGRITWKRRPCVLPLGPCAGAMPPPASSRYDLLVRKGPHYRQDCLHIGAMVAARAAGHV